MKTGIFTFEVMVGALLLLSMVACSGERQANAVFGIVPVAPVPSVRTALDQQAFLEEATGIPRSTTAIQTLVSERGNSLSSTGGTSVSANFIQASMDLAAAFCVAAVNSAASGLPQKVFPSYVRFNVAPSVANFPESTVVIPLANQLLTQFSGQKPTDAEVAIMVNWIKKFLEQQRIDNNNNNGTRRAMESSCVLAASNFESTLSR